jgi:hypothetical protein
MMLEGEECNGVLKKRALVEREGLRGLATVFHDWRRQLCTPKVRSTRP